MTGPRRERRPPRPADRPAAPDRGGAERRRGDEPGERRGGGRGFQRREGGFRGREPGFRERDGGFREQGPGFRGREPGFRERDGGYRERGPRPGGKPSAWADEGGMSVRLDPRRRDALKRLAAEAGMRPGELALLWLQERLDAEASGSSTIPAAGAGAAIAELRQQLAALELRVDELAARGPAGDRDAEPMGGEETAEAPATTSEPRRRGRTKRQGRPRAESADGERVPLHEEIAAILAERGPMRAAELARAIAERGRYRAPRSDRPLDAATVNSRVSNPHYRDRFVRRDGQIDLAQRD